MADNEKIVLGVAVDASSVKPALAGVARDAGAMARKVSAAGKDAGDGLEGIGVSAGKSAQQTKRELKSITDQIQRVQIDLATAGKSASEALQIKAGIKGIDVSTLKPQLDALRALEVAQNGFNGSLKNVGVSAGQTRMALQQLPLQFSDIVVSLQAGQKPLTVLLQQGAQIKDSFGGIGAAARALGGYVMGLVNPFTVAAAGIGAVAFAYEKGAQESRAFQNAVTLSGNAIGLSASQFSTMAQSIASVSGTRGAAAAALTEIAGTGQIAGKQIEAIGTAAILMEKATGQAVSETIKQFVKLADEPVKASVELNKQYNYLTAAVYEQIKALEEQGNRIGAVELAEKSYADTLASRAASVADNAGIMERAWRGITGAAKGAWDAMLGIGRPTTGADQLAMLEKQLSERTERNASLGIKDGLATQQLQAQIAALKGAEAGTNANTAAQAAYQATQKAGISAAEEVAKANDRAASKQEKLNKALSEYRTSIEAIRAANPQSALLDSKKIAAAEAGIREQYKETAKARKAPVTTGETEVAGIRAKVLETERYIEVMKAQGLEAAKQTEGEKLVLKIQQELLGSLKGVARANKEKALSAAQSLAAAQKESGAMEALLKAQQEFEKSRDKEIASQQVEVQKLEEKALAMEDQVRMYGLGKEAVEALSIARLQERADILAGFPGSEEQISLIEKEIEARKRLSAAADRKDGLDAGVKAANEADAAWKRTANSIESTMTDALMRAFEGGKSFARALRDTVVNMFKTMVLRPVVSAIVSPISSAIGGSLGLSGAANAASTGSNLFGLANNANSLFSAFTGGGLGSTVSGLIGSGVGAFSGLAAGNAALGGALGLGASSASAAALAAAQAGGTALTAGAATMAGSMASLGSTMAAVAGPIGLAIAGVALVSSLLSKKDSRIGGTYGFNTGTGATDYLHGPVQGSNGEDGVKQAITGTVTGINNLLKSVGSTASLSAYRAGLETSLKGRGGVMSGGLLSNGAAFGESGQGSNYNGTYYERNSSQSPDSATAAADFALDLKQSIVQALQAANDLPEVIASLVRGVDAEALTDAAVSSLLTTIDAVVVGVTGFRTVVADLPFAYLKDMSFGAAAGLIAAAGGLESLGGKLSSFYDNFYTDAEKAANTRKNIVKTLGAAGLGISADDLAKMTRPEFRKWYEDIATQLGAENPMAVALLNVESAFASITPVIDAVANAKTGLIDAYKAESSAMQSTIEKFRGFATDLRSFRDSLLTGSLSPLTPAQRYAETSSTFDKTAAATRSGSESERAAALARIQADAQALLEASRVTNASGGAYMQDFDRVREALSMAAISAASTADVATLQLDAAKSQLTALGEIDKGVYDVGQAISALATAQQAAGTASAVDLSMLARTYTPPASQGNAELIAEIRALRDEVTELRRQQSQETGALAQATANAGVNTANIIIDANSRRDYQQAPALA